MEVLLPYLLLMGCGSLGAIVLGFVWKRVSIGIAGNAVTGMAGGFCCSYLMKYVFLFLPAQPVSYAVTGLAAGVGCMILIGLLRKRFNEPNS